MRDVMSKKIDQLIIAARKASETCDRAREAMRRAHQEVRETEVAHADAQRALAFANTALLEAVRDS
jgi:hypothetical protein